MIDAKRAVALMAVIGLAASCGGGGDAAPTTTTVASTTVAPTPSSTAPAPTTTTPTTTSPTTAPPPTTPAPTEPPTTTAPPTTDPNPDQIVADVEAAALATYDFYWRCLQEPANCKPAAIAAPDSEALAGLRRTRDDLVGAGLYVSTSDPGYMVIEDVVAQDEKYIVTSCWRLTATLLGPPGLDGKPTVQNDTPGYLRQVDEYVYVDAEQAWMISTSSVIEQEPEVNACAPEA